MIDENLKEEIMVNEEEYVMIEFFFYFVDVIVY